MDRPYQFYYFVPLVTFWFFIIYGTLALWPQVLQKKANSRCQVTPPAYEHAADGGNANVGLVLSPGSRMWYMGVLVKLLALLLLIHFFAFSQVGDFK